MSRVYCVEVSRRGEVITEFTVEAPDALAAIDLVEARYGEPPQVEYKTVHHENGTKENLLVINEWHGYSFLAREIFA